MAIRIFRSRSKSGFETLAGPMAADLICGVELPLLVDCHPTGLVDVGPGCSLFISYI